MTFAWPLPLASLQDVLGLLFLLFIIFSAIVQFLKRGKGEETEEEDEGFPETPRRTTQPPPPPRQYSAEQEEVRKFLEALGKPRTTPPPPPRRATSPPPPVLRPAQQAQRPRPMPVAQPARKPLVLDTTEGDSDEEKEPSPINIITGEKTRHEFTPIERVDLLKEMQAVETAVGDALHAPGPAVVTAGSSNRAAEFRKLLSEKTSVRQAVILAEVIGRPKWS
jgi:hypothetical protein